jgi:hypothetical protein
MYCLLQKEEKYGTQEAVHDYLIWINLPVRYVSDYERRTHIMSLLWPHGLSTRMCRETLRKHTLFHKRCTVSVSLRASFHVYVHVQPATIRDV